MGLFDKMKERKAAQKKQEEIDRRNQEIAAKLSDDPYLGSKKKEINANRMRIEKSQQEIKDNINEQLRELQRLCNAHFDNENTVELIRSIINVVNQTDLGLNVGTTTTISQFIIKSIGQAKNKTLAGNRSAVDGILRDLKGMVNEMGNENTKKFYENAQYVNARLDKLNLEWNMRDLDTKQRQMTEDIKATALEIKADPTYMLADAWRQEQVNYAENMKKIAEARVDIQKRIDLDRSQMAQVEKTLRTQSVVTDRERMQAQSEVMQQKQQMEDMSADIDEAIEDLSQNESHVSNSAMGMQDLGVSNQKVNTDDLDNFLASLG